jgi:hypothetical protein
VLAAVDGQVHARDRRRLGQEEHGARDVRGVEERPVSAMRLARSNSSGVCFQESVVPGRDPVDAQPGAKAIAIIRVAAPSPALVSV